jgi:predicted PurR-regulated permease PerM
MDILILIFAGLLSLLLLVYVSQIASSAKAMLKEMRSHSEMLQKLAWQGQKAHEREERKIQRAYEEGGE